MLQVFKLNNIENPTSKEIQIELLKVITHELQNILTSGWSQQLLAFIKQYNPDFVIGQWQRFLNQQSFQDFMEYWRTDENPYELLDMIMENNWISVQKMQFLNQHYNDDWMKADNRKVLFESKFENKIPLSLRAVEKKVYPSDFELQKDFPATRKVLEKYFLDTPVDDEIQTMIKTKKMLPHYRYLLEKCNVSLKDSVDLREFLKFCYGEVYGLKVKDRDWFLNQYSNEWKNITLYDFLYQKNGCQPLDIDLIMYNALARNYQGPKKDNFVVF